MNPAVIALDAVGVRLAEHVALESVDLVQQGGIMALLGPNGSGKTTLLRCLATVLAPTSGSMTVDGLDPTRERERTEIRRRLGYLPQHARWSERATAYDLLDYIGVLREIDDHARRRRVFEVLDDVGLADRIADRVGSLSGGMVSRLGVAQALLTQPTMLLLDEPAAGLDPDERLRLRGLLADRRDRCTTIVSTHLTEEAAESDVVMVLDAGRVSFIGTPATLAALADGRSWVEPGLPPPGALASWRRADGSFRCLGTPPPGATPVAPTIEDGYLVLRSRGEGRR